MRPWMKPALFGFVGTLAALLLVGLLLFQWTMWTNARNGEAAFEFLQRVNQQQQPPTKPPTPPQK